MYKGRADQRQTIDPSIAIRIRSIYYALRFSSHYQWDGIVSFG